MSHTLLSCLVCYHHVSYVIIMFRMLLSYLTYYHHVSYVIIISCMLSSCLICYYHVSYVIIMSCMLLSYLVCYHHVSYVCIMSRMRVRVNLHYIVALMSRNPLLETDTKSEVYVTATEFKPQPLSSLRNTQPFSQTDRWLYCLAK